jgi:hypothetical protein
MFLTDVLSGRAAACLLLAHSGHLFLRRACPLSGVKPTSCERLEMPAFDPFRRFDLQDRSNSLREGLTYLPLRGGLIKVQASCIGLFTSWLIGVRNDQWF